MCLYNKLIINKKYTANKKNEGKPPLLKDPRTKYVPIGCGNCIECRKQQSTTWRVRLLEDIKTHTNGKFITLTFSDTWIKKIIEGYINENGQYVEGINTTGLEGYEIDNEIATRAIRHFNERWRKKYKKALRHWLITEIGHEGTENIHMHGIIWTDETYATIREKWKYGYIWPRPDTTQKTWVNEQTINYTVKYIHKIDEQHKTFKGKILTSPGIGHNYTTTKAATKNKFNQTNTIETYKTRTGHNITLPIYWRNKIYTEEEREKLWLIKLDKEQRWIRGEKISIKKGYDEYNKTLKWYQEENNRLGYGDGNKDQSRIEYERERRKIMIETRIQNARLVSLRDRPPSGSG